MRQRDLHLLALPDGRSVRTDKIHHAHGVAVDLKERILFLLSVHHHQQQRVRLPAEVAAVLCDLSLVVNTHQQIAADIFLGNIGLSIQGNRFECHIGGKHILHRFAGGAVITVIKPVTEQRGHPIDAAHTDQQRNSQSKDVLFPHHDCTVSSTAAPDKSCAPSWSICTSASFPSCFSMILRPSARSGARELTL